MANEETQLEAEKQLETDTEAIPVLDVDQALVLYKNLQFNIAVMVDDLVSPVTRGGKKKTENQRLTDINILKNTFKTVVADLVFNPSQYKKDDGTIPFPKALDLYKQVMAVQKAKEVIKADMAQKVVSGEVELTQEQKQKFLNEL